MDFKQDLNIKELTYDEQLARLRRLKLWIYDLRESARMVLQAWNEKDQELFDELTRLIQEEGDRIAADRAIEKLLKGE